jgi:hypothetical protein
MVIGRVGREPPVSVAAVAAGGSIVCNSARSSSAIACSFSASLDPSRLGGRLSSQTPYSSCRLTSAATAVAHRLGRDGMRGAGDVGVARPCWRRPARCRAWRSAGVIGAMPSRCLGIFHLLLSIVTVTFPRGLRPSDVWCLVIPFRWSIGAPFLRPDLRFPRAARAAAVKTGRRPPPKAAQSGLDGVGLQPTDLIRGEHGARLIRVGGSAIMPPAAAPPSCARADRPC